MAMEGLTDIIKQAVDAASGDGTDGIVPEGDGDGTEFQPVAEDQAEHGDPEGDPEPEPEPEPEVTPEPEPEPETTPKPDVSEEDPFAKEHGIKSKDKTGRENRIPFSRVKKINENTVTKAEAKWKEAHATEVSSRDARIEHYEKRLTNVGKTEEIMFGNPGQMLGMLLKVPGYKEILGDVRLDAHGHVVGVGTTAVASTQDPNDPEPTPDVDLGNGQIGYSPEQFKKLRAWDRREAAREAATAARAGFDKDFKPIKDVFDHGQKEHQKQQAMDKEINEAFTWPGFQENYEAILKAMNDDYVAKVEGRQTDFKFKGMREAYNHVMHQKANGVTETQAQMEARLRKEITDSLRRAPRSTSAGAGAATVPAGRGEEATAGGTTADVIRNAIKGR